MAHEIDRDRLLAALASPSQQTELWEAFDEEEEASPTVRHSPLMLPPDDSFESATPTTPVIPSPPKSTPFIRPKTRTARDEYRTPSFAKYNNPIESTPVATTPYAQRP